MADAEYKVIDPQARGPEAIERAFENQVAYCRDNRAGVTALVCQAVGDLLDTDRGGAFMRRVRRWAGPPLADALPLRVAGGLHALHQSGEEPGLSPIYEGLGPNNAAELVAAAIERHEAFLMPWLDGPPQTNEAGRSASFAAAFLWLVEQGLPGHFDLLESQVEVGPTQTSKKSYQGQPTLFVGVVFGHSPLGVADRRFVITGLSEDLGKESQ